LLGEAGRDWLFGGEGNDRLYGGDDGDSLFGGGGNDWLDAGSASERVFGGRGWDHNAWHWAIDVASRHDVAVSGSQGNFIAALLALAGSGADLGSRIRFLGHERFEVQLFDARGSKVLYEVEFDGSLRTGEATPRAEGEFWTVVFERAFKQHVEGQGSKAGRAQGEATGPAAALEALTGRRARGLENLGEGHIGTLRQVLEHGLSVVASTRGRVTVPVLEANRSYSVVGVRHDRVVLYSPAAGEARGQIGPRFDGYVQVSWSQFLSSIRGFWYA
jgi:hypothetical protein